MGDRPSFGRQGLFEGGQRQVLVHHKGALRAVADARSIAERLDAAQGADTWFGYPLQKHHVHLSQAFTLMGRTREAHAEQEAALFLTRSPSVMTRGTARHGRRNLPEGRRGPFRSRGCGR
ncbi:hypothetical protein [Streptomyces lydicus]|uniref:hypothetical protein n=1 Tax=Streptomyces lydicus TaxID=47763 RepID=UPI001582574D|nr:hypothetical protein [Streptomyces lydicus]